MDGRRHDTTRRFAVRVGGTFYLSDSFDGTFVAGGR
jgi:hypothetical protein